MGFDSLLGNQRLKERLITALNKGQSSHSYLISGPKGSGKHSLATLLAAALQCTGARKPCCRCNQCHKVLNGIHADVITVDDPEHKTISVKLVRETCADLYIRPNEGNKKIYIFPRAQDMRMEAQNALLKCIEEPPSYGVFLFLAEHSEQLLTTIRSRCVELRMSPLSDTVLEAELCRRFPEIPPSTLSAAVLRSEGYLGKAITLLEENAALLPQTEAFVQAYACADPAALLAVLVPMGKLKREQLRPILSEWMMLLSATLRVRSGLPAVHPLCRQLADSRSTAALIRGSEAIREALELTEANVGPPHICGTLSILLR
ncbi:MAG: DNA polymerase III subunit [Oscillospiraceae bacterium]|nr:DNA polymerase III subunit [Oscillospiraceae bacterium]